MNEVNETLCVEELKTLLSGGEINFYKDDNIAIKINGKDFIDVNFNLMLKILNMNEERVALLENIMLRYDNEEYWDYETIKE